MLRIRPAPIGSGHFFDLCFVHLRQLVEKRLGLGLVRTKRIERHPPVRLLARFGNLLHRILRTFAAKNIFAIRVRKEINLLWLPRPQILKKRFEALGGAGNLFWKSGRVAGQIECLGPQHAGGLMVPVVFAFRASISRIAPSAAACSAPASFAPLLPRVPNITPTRLCSSSALARYGVAAPSSSGCATTRRISTL